MQRDDNSCAPFENIRLSMYFAYYCFCYYKDILTLKPYSGQMWAK